MVAFTCASVTLARLMQSQIGIPIQYRRASSVLSLLESVGGRVIAPRASIRADDANGRLTVVGSAEDVADIRKAIALIDVPRRRAELAIDIDAPTDKLRFHQTVQLYGGETWTSAQSDLGLEITVVAGDNVGREVTLTVATAYRHHASASKLRLRLGESVAETFGKTQFDDASPGVHVYEQAPILTFKYTGLRGD